MNDRVRERQRQEENLQLEKARLAKIEESKLHKSQIEKFFKVNNIFPLFQSNKTSNTVSLTL